MLDFFFQVEDGFFRPMMTRYHRANVIYLASLILQTNDGEVGKQRGRGGFLSVDALSAMVNLIVSVPAVDNGQGEKFVMGKNVSLELAWKFGFLAH